LRFSSQWPTPLASLVQARGADVVFTIGLATLGYPPHWSLEASEYKAVADAVEMKGKRDE
jgi:hypothetical protein